MAETKLTAIIEVEDKATAALSKIGGNLEGFKGKVQSMAPTFKTMAVAGTAAFAAISAIAVSSFKAYADAQAQTVITNKSLENSFNSMSKDSLKKLQKELGGTKDVLGELKKQADEAGKSAIKMGFDDEEAARSYAKLFAATKSSAQATKELTIAQDLARFKGVSLEDATQKLIMVHAGATKELKTLGIAVTEGATAEQNLASIHKQTADAALEFSKTAEGAMQVMKVNSDNLKESIGGALAPAFDKLRVILVPLVQKFVDWAERNPDLIAKIIMVGAAVAGLVAVLGTLGLVLPAIITAVTVLAGPVGIILAIIVALGFAVMQVVKIFQMLRDDGTLIWEGIKIMIQEKVDALKLKIETFLNAIRTLWTTVWTAIKNFFTGIWDSIVNTAKSAMKVITDILQPIINMVDKLISKLQQVGSSIKGGMVNFGNKIIDGGKSVLGINDGIVQNGQVITTHPDDYIIATKSPGSLGGGKDINININGAVFTRDAALMMGDMIINSLRTQMRI